MDTAKESGAGFLYRVCILLFQGQVANDKNLGIARLTVEAAAGEQKRVAVQIVENVRNLELRAVLLENQDILSIIGIKGMTVVRDTIAILVSVLVHYKAGFSGAGSTKDIGYVKITPKICEVSVAEH